MFNKILTVSNKENNTFEVHIYCSTSANTLFTLTSNTGYQTTYYFPAEEACSESDLIIMQGDYLEYIEITSGYSFDPWYSYYDSEGWEDYGSVLRGGTAVFSRNLTLSETYINDYVGQYNSSCKGGTYAIRALLD